MKKTKDNNKIIKLFVVMEFITTLLITALLVVVVLFSNKNKDKAYNTALKSYDKIMMLFKRETNKEFNKFISLNYSDEIFNFSYTDYTNLYNFTLKNNNQDIDTFLNDIANDDFSIDNYEFNFVSYNLSNYEIELDYKEYNYQAFLINENVYYSYSYFNEKKNIYGSISFDSENDKTKQLSNTAKKNSIYANFIKIGLNTDKN